MFGYNRSMKLIPLENKSALNPVKGLFPYRWDLNIYRGCGHGCKYCFALYTHDYLDPDGKFFDAVYYKKNILACLEEELKKNKNKGEIINIGGVTDSYQPGEAKLKLMPDVLKLMIKYKNPIIISTKNILILRDIELIKELSELVNVNIAMTITCMDEDIRKELEPGTSPSLSRFKALKRIKEETKATIGVHFMPIIPYVTDNYHNLKAIYQLSAKIKADYVLPGTLNLRGKTRGVFLGWLEEYDKERYDKFTNLYKNKDAYKEYKKGLYQVIHKLRDEYNLDWDYKKGIR